MAPKETYDLSLYENLKEACELNPPLVVRSLHELMAKVVNGSGYVYIVDSEEIVILREQFRVLSHSTHDKLRLRDHP